MRIARLSLLALLATALAAIVAGSAGALDINEDAHLPVAEVNHYYEQEFEGEEGCIQSYYTRHSSGTVPPGLEITRDLKILGTPTTPGDYRFYVELADEGCPEKSVPSQGGFDLTVLPDLYVATEALPPATPGAPYSFQLVHAGFEGGYDEPRWLIKEGVLPAGLTLTSTGLISGTATAPGATQVVIRVEEPFRRFGEKTFTFRVGQALAAVTPQPRAAEVGRPFALQLAHTGGADPVVWTIVGSPLPAGLALDGATGRVTGTPTRAGAYAVSFQAADVTGSTATTTAQITVARQLRIATRGRVNVPRGERVEIPIRAVGGVVPVKWKAVNGRFPVGIRLNRRTGTLVGRTNKTGTFPVTIRARDTLRAEATTRVVLTLR
jgi:hypothetical protein